MKYRIVMMELRYYVPADGRLIEEGSLKVDEGMLTGESTPAEKELGVIDRTAPIGDRDNMVFSQKSVRIILQHWCQI